MLQVTATDPDTGINDVITYSIEGITHSNRSITNLMLDSMTSKCFFFFSHVLFQDATVEGLFEIIADTGIISVSSEIDREKIGDGYVLLNIKVHLSFTSFFPLLFLLFKFIYNHAQKMHCTLLLRIICTEGTTCFF